MLFDISSRVPGRAFELFVDGQPLESAEPLIRLALEIRWPLCVQCVTVRPFSFVVSVRGPVGSGKFNADAVMASAVTGAVYSAGVSFDVASVSPSIQIGLDAIQFVMELHGLGISRWREQADKSNVRLLQSQVERDQARGEVQALRGALGVEREAVIELSRMSGEFERERDQLREQRAQSMALAEQATAKLAEVRAERDKALVQLREALKERNAYARDLVIERDEAKAAYENAVACLREAVKERDAYVRDLAIAKAGWDYQMTRRGEERRELNRLEVERNRVLATLESAMAENQALQAQIDALRAERDVAQAELNGIRSLLADNYWLQNAFTGWRIDYLPGEESPWRALFGDEQRGVLDERQFVTLPEALAWLEATGREAQAKARAERDDANDDGAERHGHMDGVQAQAEAERADRAAEVGE